MFFDGPEIVTTRGLAHHFAMRFTRFWGMAPLYSPKKVILANQKEWLNHIERDGLRINGGGGIPPKEDDMKPNEKL